MQSQGFLLQPFTFPRVVHLFLWRQVCEELEIILKDIKPTFSAATGGQDCCTIS